MENALYIKALKEESKSAKSWAFLKRPILELYSYECQVKGLHCQGAAVEVHHVFFGTSAKRPLKRFVDVCYNAQPSCKMCHSTDGTKGGEAKNRLNKVSWWYKQEKMWGKHTMYLWWERVPLKVKEIFW